MPCPDAHFGQQITPDEVIQAFSKLGTAKAVGADALPAEFITKACTHHQYSAEHHFARVLAGMFQIVLTTHRMPAAWKVKCIHPIHKRGDVHQFANYRPIAVATTLYRLFTCVMAARLMSWTASSSTVPLDCQFGFRPNHSVEHNHLVLHSARDAAFASKRPAVFVKLDIDKAYDTVDRMLLWDILHKLGLPSFFIHLLQELYAQVPYVVSVNGTASQPFYCSMGLLQGCALSPMLYNLYIAPALHWLQELCVRDGLGIRIMHRPCPLSDYADDMLGALGDLAQVQRFITNASDCLAAINQHLSLDKCEVLLMGPVPAGGMTQLAGMKVVDRMKILGLWYDGAGSVVSSVGARMRAGSSKMALTERRLKDAGCMHDIPIALLVLNSDVRPALLFGSSLWGMHGLVAPDPVKHCLQRPYSTLLRRALGVPASCAHWIVLLVTGQLPIQFYIIRDFGRSWNRFIATAQENLLVDTAVRFQLQQLRAGAQCWLRDWDLALERCLPAVAHPLVHQCLLQGRSIPVDNVMSMVLDSYHQLLEGFGDPLVPYCGKRMIATVYRHMVMRALQQRPRCHSWSLPSSVRAAYIRFLACSSGLPVHLQSGLVPFAQRMCTQCSMQDVANEVHVLFHCHGTAGVRRWYHPYLVWSRAPHLGAFLADNCNEVCAQFVYDSLRVFHAGNA